MIAWVISGGGARIVQALCLIEQHLEAGGKPPDFIVGTSAGGLLAFLICKRGVDEARAEILNIKSREDIFQGNFFWGLFGQLGLWNATPLQALMHRVNYESYGFLTPGWCCAYDISIENPVDGKVYMKFGEVAATQLAATACMPVLVNPIGGMVDGGLVENTPLRFAIDNGADEIEIFLTSGKETPNKVMPTDMISLALRSVDAMLAEMAHDDMTVCLLKNNVPGKVVVAPRIHQLDKNYLDILGFGSMGNVYAQIRGR